MIVAGAGAGGGSCALYLVRAGLRVLVIDKARLPRYKACGGAIPRPVLARLPCPTEGTVRAAPDEVCFTYRGLSPVVASLPGGPVAMVMRSEFDAHLLAQSGAEVLDGTAVSGVVESGSEVQVEAGELRLTARYLVAADGAASRVARCLGLRKDRRFGGCLEAEVPLDASSELQAAYSHRALFDMSAVPWGYAWVFPKGDCLSVGIGRFRPGRVDLLPALHNAMGSLGIRLDCVPVRGHPIPYYQAKNRPPGWSTPWSPPGWRVQEPLSTRRCLLVGDAAGLVDPLLGEGIRYAIASGRLAAEAIARDNLAGYEATVWQEIGHSLATAGMVAQVLYRWPKRCFQLGIRNPATVQMFADILTEKTSYQGVARRLMLTTLGRTVRQAF